MYTNYIKTALRNIMAEKKYSFINIIGLAIGMTACILILLWVFDEINYDKHNDNYNRIYRVIREGKVNTPSALGPKLIQDLPEVETAARFIKQDEVLISQGTQNFLEDNFLWAEAEISDIFTISMITGNAKVTNPNSILISENMATKYFSSTDAIGKMIKVNDRTDFMIAGIFKDIPKNSHLKIDFIAPYKTYFQITNNNINNWFANFSYTYFLLKKGVNPEEVENKLGDVIDIQMINSLPPHILSTLEKPYPRIFYFQSLSDIHLHSHLRQEIEPNGDIKYIFLFAAIAIMILVIACINYINLSTARAGKRGKEVGIRKVAGAERKQLISQFFSESIVLTLIAMFISILLIEITLPFFNQITSRQIEFNIISNPIYLAGILIIAVFVGFSAGFYPALNLSSFKPITVLKGSFFRSKKGAKLRNSLVIIQFTITIFLIISTLIMRNQLNFVQSVEMGYSREHIITIPVRDKNIRKQINAIKSELLRSPDIQLVTTSAQLPNSINTFTTADWVGKSPDIDFTINYNTVDENYIDLFDIEIIKGRNFSSEISSDNNGVFILNETAIKTANFDNPFEKQFLHWNDKSGPIVGIMKDFHFRSLHHPIEPLYLYYEPNNFSSISIKFESTDLKMTISHIEDIIRKFSPSYPFEYSFFDEEFAKIYRSEEQLMSIFSSFAILAIIIACMGLFGLILFSTERRMKEFSIRRVLGSSIISIFILVMREFFKWIIIANVIAWPLAFFYSQKWLQSFAYRIDMNLWPFLSAAIITIVIAGLTMIWQIEKAVRSNPIDALKYE